MPDVSLVERIAKAFWEREYTDPWENAPDKAKLDFLDHARLAVAEVARDVMSMPPSASARSAGLHLMKVLDDGSAVVPDLDEIVARA